MRQAGEVVFFNEPATATGVAHTVVWLRHRMLNFKFAALDRIATQTRDAVQKRNATRSPLQGQQADHPTARFLVAMREQMIERLVLLCQLTMWMVLTGFATTLMNRTVF
jgi:hypothetical protein